MYLYRCGKDGTQKVCLEVGSLPWADSRPDRDMALVLGACLMSPCLVSLVLQSVRNIMEVTIERKRTTHVMMLWRYKPLKQDDAL
jgi:hypothetical protein